MIDDGLLRCYWTGCAFVTAYQDDYMSHMREHFPVAVGLRVQTETNEVKTLTAEALDRLSNGTVVMNLDRGNWNIFQRSVHDGYWYMPGSKLGMKRPPLNYTVIYAPPGLAAVGVQTEPDTTESQTYVGTPDESGRLVYVLDQGKPDTLDEIRAAAEKAWDEGHESSRIAGHWAADTPRSGLRKWIVLDENPYRLLSPKEGRKQRIMSKRCYHDHGLYGDGITEWCEDCGDEVRFWCEPEGDWLYGRDGRVWTEDGWVVS